ncbi:MAG: S66 peptidase family protein [Fimbriimonadaceae bacterium]
MAHVTRRAVLAGGAASLAAVATSRGEPAPLRIWPKPLEPGNTVALIAPASPTDAKDVDDIVSRLSALGLKSRQMPHVLEKTGLFAGPDSDRAADINSALADASIHAIACVRGGWGCARILPLIDWPQLRATPKPIIGFSDVSSLLAAAWLKTGVVTFHGMWAPRPDDPFTVQAWKQALMTSKPFDLFGFGNPNGSITTLTPALEPVTGTLLGGNLTVLNQLIGTGYLPSFDNGIVFLEDVNEPPYRLDRMLTQLHMAGQFSGVRAIILGQFVRCDDADLDIKSADILREFFASIDVPTVANAPFGHIRHQVILPVGAAATLVSGPSAALTVRRDA